LGPPFLWNNSFCTGRGTTAVQDELAAFLRDFWRFGVEAEKMFEAQASGKLILIPSAASVRIHKGAP
jgi:hypothetical protein